MKNLRRGLFLAALLLPAGLFSQHPEKKGAIENTVALMSNEVIQARMKALGYTNVKVDRKQELQYHIDAMKDGKPVLLDFHPQLGTMREFKTSAERLSAVRLMPLKAPKIVDVH